ncbi:MAG: hypothetical protein JWO82_750, partial [Akkermansiaceae bacterium]|nr:hypothetical protein [Akkermansiaceae bacterium]
PFLPYLQSPDRLHAIPQMPVLPVSTLATSYPPVWVLLSGLLAIVLCLIGALNLLLAFLTVLFRPRDNPARRQSCRWLYPLLGASFGLLLISSIGEGMDHHRSFSQALTAEDLKVLAIPVVLAALAAGVKIIDRRRCQARIYGICRRSLSFLQSIGNSATHSMPSSSIRKTSVLSGCSVCR